MAELEKITLGSGKVYIASYDATQGVPDDTTLCVEDNLIGYIQGGATLTWTPTTYTVEDDLGYVKEVFLTKEDVVFKTGVLTWNLETLNKLCSTGRVSETTDTRTIKIGGVANFKQTAYVVKFVHATNGNTITLVGQNTASFELAYAKDKETVINAEFTAKAMDTEGTLVMLTEKLQ